jgi:NAD(P)-dependent dehydrogenase (short-subunit alcohol dehydrogenase family)
VDLQLNGRRAIVTGGSRGIGLAVARVLAAEGARVALVARGVEALSAAAEEVGGLAVPTETGSDRSVAAMVATVVEAFGGVDILVNAAATPNQGGFARAARSTTNSRCTGIVQRLALPHAGPGGTGARPAVRSRPGSGHLCMARGGDHPGERARRPRHVDRALDAG